MTPTDDDQRSARERLIESLTRLGVLSRVDDDGRILASDGKYEYEVFVDLGRLLSKRVDTYHSRRIVLGKSSLLRLDKGDIQELFPAGLAVPGEAPVGARKEAVNYAPLQWDSTVKSVGCGEVVTAQRDDGLYKISSVCGDDGQVIG